MAGVSAGERAADVVIARKDELAARITEMMYREDPDLLTRHGERGRAKCLQDMRYNLEHLAPALALDEPDLFRKYVRWLVDLLAAHGVSSRDVKHCLELMRATLADVLDADSAAVAARAIDAGMESVPSEERA